MVQPLKSALRALCPPILWQMIRRLRPQIRWLGCHATYEEARRACHGDYSQEEILRKVRTSIRLVRDGRAVFERDSMIFDVPQLSHGLLSAVLLAELDCRAAGGRLRVLDLGGSLGSHYFQLKPIFLNHVPIDWVVIEQPHFVEAGNQEFGDGSLAFIDAHEPPGPSADLLICSSVLQYLPDASAVLARLLVARPRYILIDRTPVSDSGRGRWMVQRVPAEIYRADYPCRIFSEEELLKIFRPDYEILSRFSSEYDEGTGDFRFRGFILRLESAKATQDSAEK